MKLPVQLVLLYVIMFLFCTTPIQAKYFEDAFLVTFKNQPPSANEMAQTIRTTKTKSIKGLNLKRLPHLQKINLETGADLEQAMVLYAAHPQVQSVEKIYHYTAYKTPNDPYFGYQWALTKIQAPQSWDTNTTSPLTIAIIDTGIYADHADFQGVNIMKGYDWIDYDNDPQDGQGHGTFVAGQIGAATNNSTGIAGVIWNATLYISRVLDDEGSGSSENILSALDEVLVTNAKIINMSLGGDYPCHLSPSLQALIDQASAQGVLVVAAAGNENTDASQVSPASCNHVLAVGATTTTDTRASYSNYGSTVDLSAPGGEPISQSTAIVGLGIDYQYRYLAGTSMAAPHVAGAAAIVWGKYPNLTPLQLQTHLQNNADIISTDKYIGKRLNLYKAVLSQPESPNPYDMDYDGDLDYMDFLILMKYNDFAGIFDYSRFVKTY
jgi:subtilisin family serine protease